MSNLLTAIIMVYIIIVMPLSVIVIMAFDNYIGAVYILTLAIIGTIYVVRHS